MVTYGSSFRVGLWPTLSGVRGSDAHRWDLALPLVVARAWPLRDGLELGAGVAVGAEISWATGLVNGATVSNQATGLLLGAWPELRWKRSGFVWMLALPIRFSWFRDDPTVIASQTVTETPGNRNNPGQGNGGGPKDKVTTTTTYAPSVVDRMGGLSFSLSTGFLF